MSPPNGRSNSTNWRAVLLVDTMPTARPQRLQACGGRTQRAGGGCATHQRVGHGAEVSQDPEGGGQAVLPHRANNDGRSAAHGHAARERFRRDDTLDAAHVVADEAAIPLS